MSSFDQNGNDRLERGELPVPDAIFKVMDRRDQSLPVNRFIPFTLNIYLPWCRYRELGGTIRTGITASTLRLNEPQFLVRGHPGDAESVVNWREFLRGYRGRGAFPTEGMVLLKEFDPFDRDEDGVLSPEEQASSRLKAVVLEPLTVAGTLAAMRQVQASGETFLIGFLNDADGDMRLDESEMEAARMDPLEVDRDGDGFLSLDDLLLLQAETRATAGGNSGPELVHPPPFIPGTVPSRIASSPESVPVVQSTATPSPALPSPSPTPSPSPSPTPSPSPSPPPSPSPLPSPGAVANPTSSPDVPDPSASPRSTQTPSPRPGQGAEDPSSSPRVPSSATSTAASLPLSISIFLLLLALSVGTIFVALRRRPQAQVTIKEDPDWPLAQKFFRRKQYQKAAGFLQKVIRNEGPAGDRARGMLIESFLQLDLPDEAVRLIDQQPLDGIELKSLYSIAVGLETNDRFQEATTVLRSIIVRDASYRDAVARLRRLNDSSETRASAGRIHTGNTLNDDPPSDSGDDPVESTRAFPVVSATKSESAESGQASANQGQASANQEDSIPGLESRYSNPTRVGSGGMGDVYRVFDSILDRHIAMKVIQPRYLGNVDLRRRFVREVKALAQLSHPHIIPIYDVVLDPVPRYTMPYLEGCDLHQVLETREVDLESRFRIASETASALAHAHSTGILHRDIKPGNIFLTDEGKTILLDFGLAQMEVATQITQSGVLVGSLAYMAPELYVEGKPTRQSDIYSMGLVFYKLFTGKNAEGRTGPGSLSSRPLEPASSLAKGLPVALDPILDRCLAIDPEKRYASVDAVLFDLEEVRRKLGIVRPSFEDSGRILALAGRIESFYRTRVHTLKNIAGVMRRYRSKPEAAVERFFNPANLERILELVGDGLEGELAAMTQEGSQVTLDHCPELARAIESVSSVGPALLNLPQALNDLASQPVSKRVVVIEKWHRSFLNLSEILLRGLGSLDVDLGKVIERAGRITIDPSVLDIKLPTLTTCRSPHPDLLNRDLEVVFENLFQNALQSGASKIRVAGSLSTNGTHFMILVTNDGPPISESIRPGLFRDRVSGREDGKGTGLLTCRAAIERHGGRIDLASVAPVSFRITLDRGTLTPAIIPDGEHVS